jgi:hypothetical protein
MPEFEISKKIVKMAATSPKAEGKSQHSVIKEKRQETIHKYFKGKGETVPKKNILPDKQKINSKGLMSETKTDMPLKKQPSLPFGKQEAKKTLISRKDIPSKKNLEVGKHENSAKETCALQNKYEQCSKKRFPSGANLNTQKLSPTKKRAKKFNPDSGVKSPQKQQLAKKVKDKYKDAGNMKKRDATKTLLEKHKMNKMTLSKQGMNDRFVFTYTNSKITVQHFDCDLVSQFTLTHMLANCCFMPADCFQILNCLSIYSLFVSFLLVPANSFRKKG